VLRSVNELKGKTIHARDGEIGTVDQFLFDDESWTIRYLVIETGKLLGRKVLISPISIERKQKREGLTLSLTKEQIRNSPPIDADKPVSRQHETEYFNYYGYPYYWGGPGLWGGTSYPIGHPSTSRSLGYPDRTSGYAGTAATARTRTAKQEGDPHLRSTKEVIGYYIEASDGNIGHVEDFLIDDENWAIRYVVVDTVNWWPGKKVVIAPQWIKDVSWTESRVYVDLSRERIKNAPEYDPTAIVDRGYEDKLYDYYKSPKYWDETTLI
jgi:sporulation protein YlmC with PRC-barrel domain